MASNKVGKITNETGCATMRNGDPGYPESEPEVDVSNLVVIDFTAADGDLSELIENAAFEAYLEASKAINQP